VVGLWLAESKSLAPTLGLAQTACRGWQQLPKRFFLFVAGPVAPTPLGGFVLKMVVGRSHWACTG
jgi:hypothetical protein